MDKSVKKVYLVRSTGHGSDYYGNCETCGQSMAECFVGQFYNEYKREDGTVYRSPIGGGTYGHKTCVSPVNE